MRCLVTGADGFIGANLCRHLVARGHDVTGAALNRKHATPLDALGVDIRVEYGDVMDPAYCERIVSATEAQWVFHLAAVSIVRIAATSPSRALRVNIDGTINLLEACRDKRHVESVVCASSDKSYGYHGHGTAYLESMPLRPNGAYEVSKACADHIARLYGDHYRVPSMVVRACNVFGEGDLNWSRLVPACCRAISRGEPPTVHAGAWDMAREWIDVTSTCEAYELVAREGAWGEAYNVGSGWMCTAGAMAELIGHYAGGPAPVEGRPIGCTEIPYQQTDCSKLGALGFRPRPAFGERINQTVDWYLAHLGAARPREVSCVS